MNYFKLSGLITTVCLLTQGTLYSQSDSTSDSSLQRLDRVIVSATKSSRKISESAASVVVITRKEIQASAAKNIDDVLQYASGVQVKRSVGMGEGVPSDIVLRGIPGALAAARVLILVDGIPTNVAGTPFLIVNEIPLDAIQRIEIVKGPFSSLYGANALGGVINIITIQGDGKPTFTVSGETSYPFTILDNAKGDNPDLWDDVNVETYWNASVQSSGKIGKYDYLVSAGARTIGNYFLNDSVM
ncbi:MAG: TonB-dependent receptor, partial [Fibrobacterota bacterium]|nr:TonB-dependent receptor plug domain-containing protein [Chitinispirillaceae bacterium]